MHTNREQHDDRHWRYARRVMLVASAAAISCTDVGVAPDSPRVQWQTRVENVFHTRCADSTNANDSKVHCENGCAYTWADAEAATEAGIVVSCPSRSGKPWIPDCETDSPYGLGDPTGNGSCWAPPTHWCYAPALLTVTFACDPMSDHCCVFVDECVPCGWEFCAFGPSGASSAKCQAGAGKNTCPSGLAAMVTSCVVCGRVTVCPL